MTNLKQCEPRSVLHLVAVDECAQVAIQHDPTHLQSCNRIHFLYSVRCFSQHCEWMASGSRVSVQCAYQSFWWKTLSSFLIHEESPLNVQYSLASYPQLYLLNLKNKSLLGLHRFLLFVVCLLCWVSCVANELLIYTSAHTNLKTNRWTYKSLATILGFVSLVGLQHLIYELVNDWCALAHEFWICCRISNAVN